MALNSRFITAPELQQYFVDKDTGLPLSGGQIYFYSDVNRTAFKNIYELTGTPPNYEYRPLPNPITLSAVGTPMNDQNQDVVIYYEPFNDDDESELYYVRATSAGGVQQWTRQAWPNPNVVSGGATNDIENFIPNGQFLLHNDLPDSKNILAGGVNVIAYGGWEFVLNDPVNSTNTLVWETQGFTEDPAQSPRYIPVFTCQANALDTIKNLRVKFDDVNKFSTTDDFYTFTFQAETNVNVPVSIQVYRFFGTNGSAPITDTVANLTITPDNDIYNVSFQFESNAGLTIDLVNNDDFVAIVIDVPRDLSFELRPTNSALTLGQNILTGFPIQTDADMVARAADGWTDKPRTNGFDLYLPKILTRYGYRYDDGQIGNIVASSFPLTSPLSTSPLPTTNDMPCDGASYINGNFSAIGIPFARLGEKLLQYTFVPNIPRFGTGDNYVTNYLWNDPSDNDKFRLIYNLAGAGSPLASDGTTGWTFTGLFDYNGSATGATPIPYIAYTRNANQFIAIATFDNVSDLAPSVGTTPFTIADGAVTNAYPGSNRALPATGVLAQQKYNFIVTCTDGSTLVAGSGNPGLYFEFSDDSGGRYYIWYLVSGETDPAPGGSTYGIRVTVESSYTAQDIADVTREAMNTWQGTDVQVTTSPLTANLSPGDYWLFSSNPGSIRDFYVWYTVDGVGVDPNVALRTGIRVDLISSNDAASVAFKTQLAVNAYQYQAPDLEGLFLRGFDPDMKWDFGASTERFSSISGVTQGAQVGTFQYPQLQEHIHHQLAANNLGTANRPYQGTNAGAGVINTQSTGGTETRPANFAVEWAIKY